MSRTALLISFDELKDRTQLQQNVDEKLLTNDILTAQDVNIESALGSALYTRMQDASVAGDFTTDEETLRSEYIAPALIQFVLASLSTSLNYQFYSKGVIQRTADNTLQPSMSDLVTLSKTFTSNGEYYKQRLINYLVKNNDTFPLYTYDSDNDINPVKSGYEINAYFGDDDTCNENYG